MKMLAVSYALSHSRKFVDVILKKTKKLAEEFAFHKLTAF